MSNIESALRGGAVALLVLLAVLLIRDARRLIVARFALLYVVGVIAYVVVSASAFIGSTSAWLLPVRIIGAGNPVVFWLLAAALFDDEFVPSRRHLALWTATAFFCFACYYLAFDFAHAVATLVALAFNVAALRYALVGQSEDLVEQRRRLRVAFVVAVSLYSIAQITTEFFVASGPTRVLFETLNAAGIAAIIFVFCLDLLSLRRNGALISIAAPKRSTPQAKPEPAAESSTQSSTIDAAAKQDETWLVALKRIMEKDRIYREEALSVAALADKLGLPDYRLRRLINQQLGYRNFTAFLNDYRLADVMAALSEPARAEIPVLTLALEAGFQSIGPFNRAFKAHTGLTPTEFRQQALAKAQRRSAA